MGDIQAIRLTIEREMRKKGFSRRSLIIYVRRDHEGVLPSYFGKYCAVRTADGGTFLKILAPGSERDRYTLRSLNAEDMVDVEVRWASPVLFVMPKQPPKINLGNFPNPY